MEALVEHLIASIDLIDLGTCDETECKNRIRRVVEEVESTSRTHDVFNSCMGKYFELDADGICELWNRYIYIGPMVTTDTVLNKNHQSQYHNHHQ